MNISDSRKPTCKTFFPFHLISNKQSTRPANLPDLGQTKQEGEPENKCKKRRSFQMTQKDDEKDLVGRGRKIKVANKMAIGLSKNKEVEHGLFAGKQNEKVHSIFFFSFLPPFCLLYLQKSSKNLIRSTLLFFIFFSITFSKIGRAHV